MSLSQSSSREGGLGASTTGGGGTVTEMLTLASALPPAPVAVMVYVAVSAGVTVVEPCAVTAPTSGAIETFCASVVVHVRRVDSPFWMEVRSALMLAVGFAAGGGGGGGATSGALGGFLQAPMKRARKQKEMS